MGSRCRNTEPVVESSSWRLVRFFGTQTRLQGTYRCHFSWQKYTISCSRSLRTFPADCFFSVVTSVTFFGSWPFWRILVLSYLQHYFDNFSPPPSSFPISWQCFAEKQREVFSGLTRRHLLNTSETILRQFLPHFMKVKILVLNNKVHYCDLILLVCVCLTGLRYRCVRPSVSTASNHSWDKRRPDWEQAYRWVGSNIFMEGTKWWHKTWFDSLTV